MKTKDNKEIDSITMLALYLNGQGGYSLDDVKNQERKEEFRDNLNKYSFNNKYLKKIVFIPVSIAFMLKYNE